MFLQAVDLGKTISLPRVQPCSTAGVQPRSSRYHLVGTADASQAGVDDHRVRRVDGAIQQADAADEAGACDGASQLIRSVGRTSE